MFVPIDQLPAASRVWVYQSPEALPVQVQQQLQQRLEVFLESWAAHGQPLRASAAVLYNHFVVIAADERYHAPSGCSIDATVHLVQELEKQFGITLFDRQHVALDCDGEVEMRPLKTVREQIARQEIASETLVFNPLVGTLGELRSRWRVEATESWLSRYFAPALKPKP